MNKAIKIDTSLRERRSIIRLLDYLKRDDLTTDQMERIGKRLRKSGGRALRPLVRKLWQEQNGTAVYRYTCMLDFFDKSGWLDQLIQITLKRKDLDEDARLALLSRLQETGIDVTSPPFAAMTGYGANSIEGFISDCMKDGERGQVRFMDYFLDAADEIRERMIGCLVEQGTAAAVAMLEVLLFFDREEVIREVIVSLGRIKEGVALSVLQRAESRFEGELLKLVRRSIQRLTFLGIAAEESLPEIFVSSWPFHDVQAGPVDIYGARSLLFSWRTTAGGFAVLLLLASDREGVINALSYRMRDETEYESVLRDVMSGELLEPVDPDYGLELLNDAIYRSRQDGYMLPPDLYVDLRLFETGLIRPAEQVSRFSLDSLENFVERIPAYLPESSELLDSPCFEGWLLSEPAVYDAAERVTARQSKSAQGALEDSFVEEQLQHVCEELIEPRKADLVRRLLLTADFMQQVEAGARPLQQTLAVALTLAGGLLPVYSHPFIRRLVLDSIETARQALAEGYDLRQEEAYYDE